MLRFHHNGWIRFLHSHIHTLSDKKIRSIPYYSAPASGWRWKIHRSEFE